MAYLFGIGIRVLYALKVNVLTRVKVSQIAPLLAKTDALIIVVSAFIHEKNNFCLGLGQNINPQNQH